MKSMTQMCVTSDPFLFDSYYSKLFPLFLSLIYNFRSLVVNVVMVWVTSFLRTDPMRSPGSEYSQSLSNLFPNNVWIDWIISGNNFIFCLTELSAKDLERLEKMASDETQTQPEAVETSSQSNSNRKSSECDLQWCRDQRSHPMTSFC